MKQPQIIEGAKTGLVIGVRRGDLDLVKTCYDLLLDDQEDHQAWITWRLPNIVQEEAFHLLGDMARLAAGLPDEDDQEAAQFRFLRRLTVAKKAKDAGALRYMVAHATDDDPLTDNHEFKLLFDAFELLKTTDMGTVAAEVYESTRTELGVHGEYELAALKLLHGRAVIGGRLTDRFNNLAAMVMIGTRGLDEKLADRDVRKGARRWITRIAEKRLPKTVNLPWYVWDHTTTVGKKALELWERDNTGVVPGVYGKMVEKMWYCLETTKTPVSMINYQDGKLKGYEPLDTVWWLDAIRWTLTSADEDRKYTPKEQGELWREAIRDQIKEYIEQLVDGEGTEGTDLH